MANTYLRVGEKEALVKELIKRKYGKIVAEGAESLRNMILSVYDKVVPKELAEVFIKYPKHFTRSESVNIYYNKFFNRMLTPELKKFLGNCYDNRYINLIKDNNKPSHLFNDYIFEMYENWAAEYGYKSKEYLELEKCFQMYISILKEKDELKKKLECVIEKEKWTPTKLKNEFPEAYKIYMENQTNGVDTGSSKNLCDSVENLRAIFNSNKPVAKE